jgi:hypothetical protein
VQALEELFFFYGVGALILFFAATALGRLSVQSVRDVTVAEQRAARAETTEAPAPTAEGEHASPAPPPAAAAGEPPQPAAQHEPTHQLPESETE